MVNKKILVKDGLKQAFQTKCGLPLALAVCAFSGCAGAMKKIGLNLCITLVIGVVFMSCATKDPYGAIDLKVGSADFDGAIALIQEDSAEKKPVIYPEKASVMYNLDKGVLEYYDAQYKNAFTNLEEAETFIQENRTKSASEAVFSAMTSDDARTYPGEDYEDIYSSVFTALSNYHLGSLENARVESRQINEKLQIINEFNAAAVQKAQEEGTGKFTELGIEGLALPSFNPHFLLIPADEASKVSFNNSALANYLSMVLFRGTPDAAFSGRQITEAYKNAPDVYGKDAVLPSELQVSGTTVKELDVPQGKGRLNIIAFAGLSPLKNEFVETFSMPFLAGLSPSLAQLEVPIALPELKNEIQIDKRLYQRGSSINKIVWEIEGGATGELFLLEDMGKVVEKTFNSSYGSVFSRTFLRSAIQAAISGVAVVAAEKQSPMAGKVAVGALNAALKGLASADVRMARYLPRYAYVGGVTLDPGAYKVTIKFYGGGSEVGRTAADVEVKADSANIIEGVCLK
jgi:hypothetical protein